MGPQLTVLIIEVHLFQSVHNNMFDCSFTSYKTTVVNLMAILDNPLLYGLYHVTHSVVIQLNLAIPTTLGTNKSGWISKMAGLQGQF